MITKTIKEGPFAIGLDMGGTNSVFGIVNKEGKIVAQTAIKTKGFPNVEAYVKAGTEALKPSIEKVGGIKNIIGMGIGAPNGNYYTGNIENAPNLDWRGIVPIARLFTVALDIPAQVTNDANAAAMGEMTYGIARNMKNFIMITLGTGVGSGIVVDGKVVYGSDGFAGELGHVVVDNSKDARLCGCGRKGCLETYCSATGVARTARMMLKEKTADSPLRQIAPENITSLDVFLAAEKDDAIAKDIFNYTGDILGRACANFAAFNSPEAFVFFGGLTKSGKYIMDPIRKAYNDNVLFNYKGKTKLLVSTLEGSDAAVLGASALAWDEPENK